MSRSDHLGTNGPAAYLLTFSCYGTRLHGDPRGSVSRLRNLPGTPFVGPDERMAEAERAQTKGERFVLDASRRECVSNEIARTADIRGWRIVVMNVRTTHAHVVVSAPEVTPERVINDFKVWCTRRLREAGLAGHRQQVWSRHGSTIYLFRAEDVDEAAWYVAEEQGAWLSGCGAPRPTTDSPKRNDSGGDHQPLAGARGTDPVEPFAGLCQTCRHARTVVSGKGSVFWLCERSKTDPRFRKYPPIPVVQCEGYEAVE